MGVAATSDTFVVHVMGYHPQKTHQKHLLYVFMAFHPRKTH